MKSPFSSCRPGHFRARFFPAFELAGEDLSPPDPIHSLPSAIPAAIRPVEEIAVDKTKGGESDTPLAGGVAAEGMG